MKNIINKINAFIADEKGGEVVEWVIVVAILAGIAIASYQTALGAAITTAMGLIITSLGQA